MGSGGTGERLHAAASSSMVENRWGFMYRASLACRSDLLTMVLDEKRICIVDTSVHIWTLCAVTTSTAIIAEILKTSRDKTVSKHHAQTPPPYPSSPSDPVPSTSHPSLCHESHRLPFLHHHDSLPPLRLSPQLSRRPCPHFSRRGTLSASMGVPPIRCPPGRAPFSSPRAFSMAGR